MAPADLGYPATSQTRGEERKDKRHTYDRMARWYDLLDLGPEYGRYQAIRPRIFAGLGGRLLDAGVGTGRNIPFYPSGSTVTGIDLSPAMLRRAAARRDRGGHQVELLERDVRTTGLPAAEFDAITATFLFCVLDAEHQLPALTELARLVKPEGEIRLLDYRLSERPFRRFMMQRVWGPWVYRLYGAAFDRNTEQYVEAAGLEVVEAPFLYRDIIRMLRLKPAVRA